MFTDPFPYRKLLHSLQKEGLHWLREAGIAVILDHHALPGVSSDNQMFAGQ
jgi:aryl-phospho-beta-D-glucosidase BglC (GH1 family)